MIFEALKFGLGVTQSLSMV